MTAGTRNYAAIATPRWTGKLFGWILFIGLAIIFSALFQLRTSKHVSISFTQLNSEIIAGNVSTMSVSDDEVTGEFQSPLPTNGTAGISFFRCSLPTGPGGNLSFIDRLTNAGVAVTFDRGQDVLVQVLVPVLPWLLILGFIWLFVLRPIRQATELAAKNRPAFPAQSVEAISEGPK